MASHAQHQAKLPLRELSLVTLTQTIAANTTFA